MMSSTSNEDLSNNIKFLQKNSNEVHDPSKGGLKNLRSRSIGNLNVVSRESTDMEEESRDLIFGGTEIQENDYPYLAYLSINKPNENTTFCGGTLIDPNWILTTASCVDTALNITAWLGVHNISSVNVSDPGVEYHSIYPVDIYIYPGYDSKRID